jgi:hypothetical protein
MRVKRNRDGSGLAFAVQDSTRCRSPTTRLLAALHLTRSRRWVGRHIIVFDVRRWINQALQVECVIVRFGNVNAGVGNDSLSRLPKRQQEKVHPRAFCPMPQMDPANAGMLLIVSKAKRNQ